MNKLWPVVVLIGGVVFAGALYVLAPVLETGAAVARRDSDEQVQRAMRLLAKFDEGLVRRDRVLTTLAGMDVAIDLEDEYVQALVDADPELLSAAAEEDTQWVNSRRSARSALQGELSKLTGESSGESGFDRGGFGQSVAQSVSAIQKGVATRDELLAENRALLDGALAAANEALQADGNHPQAHEIKGIIQSYQGKVLAGDAFDLRTEGDPYRLKLNRLGRQVQNLERQTAIVSKSDIDAAIARNREVEQRLVEQIASLEEEAGELSATILRMESRAAELRKQANGHRSKMDQLEDAGVSFSDPMGGARFAEAYDREADAYRGASRRVDELENGHVGNAMVDRSGDYVDGAIVAIDASRPMTQQPGLVHLRAESAALQQRIETTKLMLEDGRRRVTLAKGEKDRLQQMADQAAAQATELRVEATKAFDELMLIESEASSLERDAIVKLESAGKSFMDAARLAKMESSEAGDRISHLPMDKRSRSPWSILADDRWTSARMSILEASSKLALGRVYLRRMSDAAADAEVVSRFADALELGEADGEAFTVQKEEAMDAGTAVVTDALSKIERVSRDLGNHWSVAAMAAGAAYQLAMLGDPDMAELALTNYRAVVDQRQDSPYVRAYLDRITILEKRMASPTP